MVSTKRTGLKRWFTLKSKPTGSKLGSKLENNPCSELLGKPLLDLHFCMIDAKLSYESLPVTIPSIVLICCDYLRMYGSSTVGLFRVSSLLSRLQALQTLFETNPNGTEIDLKELGFTPYEVAGVLTRFLKSLPEPVIPIDHFQAFRETSPTNLAGFQHLVLQLPRLNSDLLLYLLDFLHDLSKHSESTRMPADNLSAVFQPSILLHTSHVLIPEQYQLSQLVVTNLITDFYQIIPDFAHRKEIDFTRKHQSSDFVAKRQSSDWIGKRQSSDFAGKRQSSDFTGKRQSSTSSMVKKWLYRSNSTSSTLVEENPSTYRTCLSGCQFNSPPKVTKPTPTTNHSNFIQRTLSQLRRVR